MSKEKIYIFDTTLRDGAQTQGVDFSMDEKDMGKVIEAALFMSSRPLALPAAFRPPFRGKRNPGQPGYQLNSRLFQPRFILHYTRSSWRCVQQSTGETGDVNARARSASKKFAGGREA